MQRTSQRAHTGKYRRARRKATAKKSIKLNIGCGHNKFPGFINIDKEKRCKPDLHLNICKSHLPFENNSVSQVWMCHTIEHIEKKYRSFIFTEVNRVLRIGGVFVLTFPNFRICLQNYLDNARGEIEFWEATIYGRQLHRGDFHVAAIEPDRIIQELKEYGFALQRSCPEKDEEFNHLISMSKSYDTLTQEDLVKAEYR